MLVDVVAASPKAATPLTGFDGPDRAFLIAGLTARGFTAQEISEKLGCTSRMVKFVRADPMTAVCVWAHQNVQDAATDLHGERLEHQLTRRELDRRIGEVDRLRKQVEHLFRVLRGEDGLPCGHPRDRWNLYAHGGRVFCRECNRVRAKAYRDRKRHTGV